MKITAKDTDAALANTDLLVVLAPEGSRLALPKGVKLPKAARDDFEGKFRASRMADADGPVPRVLLVGLGAKGDVDLEKLRRAAAVGAKAAERAGAARCAMWVSDVVEKAVGGPEAAGQAIAEAVHMSAYRYQDGKSKAAREKAKVASMTLHGSGAAFRRGVKRGTALGEANSFARDLQNASGNMARPRDLAAAGRKLATRSVKITCKVHDEKAMKAMGMGLLLGVSRGSDEPAYLIHLTYKPKGRSRGKVALVGKGLTFDAGGISLKPSPKMEDMKYDMSGSASVLGVFHALASMDVPYEVHGVVAASENMPGGKATKPGDIHTGMAGKTVEVLNTDAEGRLILADALTYTSKKIKPDTILDLATLTGAVVVALGHELTGYFPNTKKLEDELRVAGDVTGELVWPLPLLDCHKEQMKGQFADLRNINSPGQGNGSTSGAAFLVNFVGDAEWAHLDIAGTAWGQRDRDYVGGPQGSGVGVRLLMQYLETRK
jgi:leucyl aminopeptidase